MRRLAMVVLCLGLAACGGQDEAEKAASEAGQAMEDAAKAAQEAADAAARQMEEALDAAKDLTAGGDAQSCLDLVEAGSFSEAVPVCSRALAADPTDQAVQDALDEAKAAAAGEAAGAAEGVPKEMGEEMP
jgi:hypothetical protein